MINKNFPDNVVEVVMPMFFINLANPTEVCYSNPGNDKKWKPIHLLWNPLHPIPNEHQILYVLCGHTTRNFLYETGTGQRSNEMIHLGNRYTAFKYTPNGPTFELLPIETQLTKKVNEFFKLK